MSARLVPMVDWVRTYERRWLRGDLVAGVVVAALIVPKNLGYAGIAGVPLQNGLYAAAAGGDPVRDLRHQSSDLDGPQLGAGCGGCRSRAGCGITGGAEVATFVAGITLAAGLLFLLLAVLKMGWVARFLSRAVVTGFLFGAAIDVVIGELPKLTGTEASGDNSFQELRSWLGSLGDVQTDHVCRRSRSTGGRLRAAHHRAARPRGAGARRGRAPGHPDLRPRGARRGARR